MSTCDRGRRVLVCTCDLNLRAQMISLVCTCDRGLAGVYM